jgi:acetylornithine/N-succinyldiaminopimelate aminotransferase
LKAAGILRRADRHLMKNFSRPPVVFTRGRGCYVWDHRGKKYLDFLGGLAVNALGHAHPRLVRAIRKQAARAIHISNLFHNEFQAPLAAKLAAVTGLDRAFLCNSGTEAIEAALKLARAYARKHHPGAHPAKMRFLALENSFHGRTCGALALTATAKYREPFEPLVPGAEFVRFNDVADLEAKFDASVCAIFLEPIQGEGGVRPVSEAFYTRARALATQQDAALIADEIQCGLGRTGRWLASHKFAAPPDVVCLAKPLAGGLPLGAVVANEKFAAAFSPGMHGTTFGGGPLTCAAALAFLEAVEKERLLENVRDRGTELKAGLEMLAAKFGFVREVRGEGLMLGVELSVPGAAYAAAAMRRGLLLNCTHEYTLRLLPPFIVTAAQVREFLTRFEAVLAKTPRPKPEAESTAAAPKARAAAR